MKSAFAGVMLLMLFSFMPFYFAVSCVNVKVHPRDNVSIEHWDIAQLQYREDIARAAGLDDPNELTEGHFPIGDLTWDEYLSQLATLSAWKQYEESKPDPDDVKNRGNRPQTQPGNDPQGDNDGGDR